MGATRADGFGEGHRLDIPPAQAGAKGLTFQHPHQNANPAGMAIAPLPHSARDYVRAFDLMAICQWRDGRLGVSGNPAGAEAAWWCPAKARRPDRPCRQCQR